MDPTALARLIGQLDDEDRCIVEQLVARLAPTEHGADKLDHLIHVLGEDRDAARR